MNRIFLLLVLFIIGTRTTAQSYSINQSEFVDSAYLIELPYQKIKGTIIVDVQIQNQQLKFILDTGAATAISNKLFENLGLEILSREIIPDANGNMLLF